MGWITISEISITKFINEIFIKYSRKGILENNVDYHLICIKI